jgi:hypothetical protein
VRILGVDPGIAGGLAIIQLSEDRPQVVKKDHQKAEAALIAFVRAHALLRISGFPPMAAPTGAEPGLQNTFTPIQETSS